jgi:hypothetical protein
MKIIKEKSILISHKKNPNIFEFDYIIRIRSDIIISKKIDFSFLDLSNEDILKKIS